MSGQRVWSDAKVFSRKRFFMRDHSMLERVEVREI